MDVLRYIYQEELKQNQHLSTDKEIYEFLIKNGHNRNEVLQSVHKKLNISYLDEVAKTQIDRTLRMAFEKFILITKKYIPLYIEGNIIYFASSEIEHAGLDQIVKMSEQEEIQTKRPVVSHFIFEFELQDTLQKLYDQTYVEPKKETAEIKHVAPPVSIPQQEMKTPKMGVFEVNDMIQQMIQRGIFMKASDIHIEQGEKEMVIRYRVNGVLYIDNVLDISIDQRQNVINRLKVMAELNINEKRKPQDGKIAKYEVADKEYEFRVSSMNTIHGEKIVLRIFEKNKEIPTLESLGFDVETSTDIRQAIMKKNGLILITGGTGSGKTTTIYGMLMEMNRDSLNIYTLEDPVEMVIPRVNQIHVTENSGDYAEQVTALLRQDPDVIVMGEIRNLKTAKSAMEAAFTGHLVIATYHTNGILETFDRMLLMGVEPYEVMSSFVGIGTQHLIKHLCHVCKQNRPIDEVERSFLEQLKQNRPDLQEKVEEVERKGTHDPIGCDHCNNTGYEGRSVISEFILLNDEIKRDILAKEITEKELYKKYHIVSMQEQTIEKVRNGLISLKEVISIVRP